VIHPLAPEDSVAMTALRSAVVAMKGKLEGVAARGPFNGIMERGAAPDALSFEAEIRAVLHCRTREGYWTVLLGAKARNRGNHRRVRPLQTGSRQASVVHAKISATCKVRTAWVAGSNWYRSFSNGKSS
jgi:hypothetical protein